MYFFVACDHCDQRNKLSINQKFNFRLRDSEVRLNHGMFIKTLIVAEEKSLRETLKKIGQTTTCGHGV